MPRIEYPDNPKDLALFCSQIADDKIAENIILMNLHDIETAPAEYFVVCTCESDVQMKAIVDEIRRQCTAQEIQKPRIEGLDTAQWVLLDFFDVVMHLLMKDLRNYYKIEKLWGDADLSKIDENGELEEVSLDNINDIYEDQEMVRNGY